MASPSNVVFHFDKEYAPNRVLHVLRVLQNAELPIMKRMTWEKIAREQSIDDKPFG